MNPTRLEFDAGVEGRAAFARFLFSLNLVFGVPMLLFGPVAAMSAWWFGWPALVLGFLLVLTGSFAIPFGLIAFVRGGTIVDPEVGLVRWWKFPFLKTRETRLPLEGATTVEVRSLGTLRYPRHTVVLVGEVEMVVAAFSTKPDADEAAHHIRTVLRAASYKL